MYCLFMDPDGRPDYFHCDPSGTPEEGADDYCTATYAAGGTWSFGGEVPPGEGTCTTLQDIKTERNLNVHAFTWQEHKGHVLGPNITVSAAREQKCQEQCLFQATCAAYVVKRNLYPS